jgi:hypothetical protein
MKTPRARLAHLAAHGTPPDPQTAQQMSVGLKETLTRFDSEVFPFLSAGGTEIQFVYGANGRGKTHYLLSVEAAARSKGFVTARIDCPVGASPFGSLRTTFETVAASLLPPPELDADGTPGVCSIIRTALSDGAKHSALEVIAGIKSSKDLCPDFRNLVVAYGRGCISGTLTERVQEDLEALITGSQTRAVTVGALYKADKTLPRPLGRITSRNAANWLRSLLSLPYALGYPGVVIMFDETERAFHRLGARALQEQLAHLRNIVDYCALGTFGGCLIMYAAAEDFIDLSKQHLDALAQRIEPPTLLKGGFPSSIRSVWTDLDDLTSPQTSDKAFFNSLADRIMSLGMESGLSQTGASRLKTELAKNSARFASSPTSSIVREFVKRTATAVLLEVKGRG